MINIRQWAQDCIESPKRYSLPIMTHPGIEISGKTVKEAVCNGKIHSQAIIDLNQKFPADGSTVIMDLTVEAEAFGAEIIFPEDEVPSVIGRLVTNREEIEALQIPTLDTGRIQTYLLANRLSAQTIQNKPVFGGCIGPFSLAGRLFDISEMMMALYIEPEAMEILLEKCTTFILNYCQAIKETGVNGVILAEPAAGLISNDDSIRFSSFYAKKIIDTVQDDNFMVIFHNCGNGGHCTESMVKTGAKALHFGNKIDMISALNQTPKDILVLGNLDPVVLFKQSSSDTVYRETTELLEATKQWPNFIISSGCDIPPHIPFENIESFYKAINDFNSQNRVL